MGKRKAVPRKISTAEASDLSFSVVGNTNQTNDQFVISEEIAQEAPPFKRQRHNHFATDQPKSFENEPFYPICTLEVKIPRIDSGEMANLLESQKFIIKYSLQSTPDPRYSDLFFSLYDTQDRLITEQTLEKTNILAARTSFGDLLPIPGPNVIQSLAHCLNKQKAIFYLHFVL